MFKRASTLTLAAGLGLVAGIRSMQAPALMSRCLRGKLDADSAGALAMLTSPVSSGVLRVMSIGEMIADKLPFIPARTTLLPLAGRVVAGALSGAALAQARKESRRGAVIVASLAALGSTYLVTSIRTLATGKLRIPDVAIGLAEDAVVSAACRSLAAAID
jgi:uncharacterized membrane protein